MHQYSYHEKDPQLKGGKDETTAAQIFSRRLEEIWPNLDLCHSNHASLVYRKAKTAGIPELFLKSYREVHGVTNWNWHFQMNVELPDGSPLHIHHGTRVDAWNDARRQGINSAAAHRHSEHSVRRFNSFVNNRWATQVGCGIDAANRAFAYGKEEAAQPILGMTVVLNSFPYAIPMNQKKSGRWDGKVVFK
jgi:hypothetical protein